MNSGENNENNQGCNFDYWTPNRSDRWLNHQSFYTMTKSATEFGTPDFCLPKITFSFTRIHTFLGPNHNEKLGKL
jgi:hypothetical protein